MKTSSCELQKYIYSEKTDSASYVIITQYCISWLSSDAIYWDYTWYYIRYKTAIA